MVWSGWQVVGVAGKLFGVAGKSCRVAAYVHIGRREGG